VEPKQLQQRYSAGTFVFYDNESHKNKIGLLYSSGDPGKADITRNCVVNLDHRADVALRPSKFGRIFDLDQNDEEQVVPHVVLQFAVFLKRHRLVVKCRPIQTYTCGQRTSLHRLVTEVYRHLAKWDCHNSSSLHHCTSDSRKVVK